MSEMIDKAIQALIDREVERELQAYHKAMVHSLQLADLNNNREIVGSASQLLDHVINRCRPYDFGFNRR